MKSMKNHNIMSVAHSIVTFSRLICRRYVVYFKGSVVKLLCINLYILCKVSFLFARK